VRAEEEARDNIALGGRPDQGAQADETAYSKSLLDWHRMARDWSLIVSSGMVGLVLAVTVVGPFIVPADPNVVHSANRLLPPFWMEGGNLTHPLGTDGVGRDLLARIVVGFRTSLFISVTGVLLAVAIGAIVGILAGFVGRWVDTVLMGLTDVQLSFPFIVLAVSLLSLVPPSPPILIVVLSLAAWPMYARVIRSIVQQERNADYVVAARSTGASEGRIIYAYIVRNIVPSVLVVATIDIATLVVFESLLSFLGLGVQPPTASWGNIIAEGKNYLTSAWWITTLPGVAIVFTVLSFNLFGDNLHRYIDPRSS